MKSLTTWFCLFPCILCLHTSPNMQGAVIESSLVATDPSLTQGLANGVTPAELNAAPHTLIDSSTGATPCNTMHPYKYYEKSGVCTACPAGYGTESPAYTSCVACPAGFYDRPEVGCVVCPGSFYNTGTAETSCQSCPQGYSNAPSSPTNTAPSTNCVVCPPGTKYVPQSSAKCAALMCTLALRVGLLVKVVPSHIQVLRW